MSNTPPSITRVSNVMQHQLELTGKEILDIGREIVVVQSEMAELAEKLASLNQLMIQLKRDEDALTTAINVRNIPEWQR